MPIHDLGYRGWTGKRSSENLRWWVIAETGIRLAWQSRWVRRMFISAWLPVLAASVAIFIYEQTSLLSPVIKQGVKAMQLAMADPPQDRIPQTPSANAIEDSKSKPKVPNSNRNRSRNRRSNRMNPESQKRLQSETDMIASIASTDMWQTVDADNPNEMRHAAWSTLLYILYRYPQGLLMALLVGLLAPPLISRDFRSKAFLVYFSRPLSALEYAFGKGLIIAGFLMAITTFPALFLYFLGILLSPELSVIASTWDIPFRILIASLVLTIPTTVVALCFSSMTEDSRYAGFAWFVIWIIGFVTYQILSGVAINAILRQRFDSSMTDSGLPEFIMNPNLRAFFSPYHTLGVVQQWAFGLQPNFLDVLPHFLVLTFITVVASIILMKRVSKPMQI